MAYDYAPIKATAAALLADFGQSVTIRAYTVSGSDPAAGTVTRSSSDTAASCVKTRFNERNTPPGTLIEQGDLLAILDKVVAIDDEIIIGSDTWQVIDVFPVEPGATGVIWKAQIRR